MRHAAMKTVRGFAHGMIRSIANKQKRKKSITGRVRTKFTEVERHLKPPPWTARPSRHVLALKGVEVEAVNIAW